MSYPLNVVPVSLREIVYGYFPYLRPSTGSMEDIFFPMEEGDEEKYSSLRSLIADEDFRKYLDETIRPSDIPFPNEWSKVTRGDIDKMIQDREKARKNNRLVNPDDLVRGDLVQVEINGGYHCFLLARKFDNHYKEAYWEAHLVTPFVQYAMSFDVIVPVENGYENDYYDVSHAVINVINNGYLHFPNGKKVSVLARASENLLIKTQAVYDQVVYDACSNLPVNYNLDENRTRLAARGVQVMTGHPYKNELQDPRATAKKIIKTFLEELNEKTLAELSQ
jgi:hypothetical protein